MIPLRLELRNFLSYAEGHAPLSLEDVHVVCLSGSNGHGKSALLDAIIWALWGVPRGGARAGDDLIRHGAREMHVSLEFELHGIRYRVTRKRVRRGRDATTDLHLESHDGMTWRSLTGGWIADTQRTIGDLLRMSHHTFVHASFIAQGKADAFMTLEPADRKKVLAEILDLSRYEQLAEAARETARRAKSESDRLSSLIESVDQELERRAAYVAQLEQTEEAERDAQAVEDRVAAERGALLQIVARLKESQRLASNTAMDVRRAEERVHALEIQLQELDQQVAENDVLVRRADSIEHTYAQYLSMEEEERELAARSDEWLQARDDVQEVEATIERDRARLEAALPDAQRRISEIERRLASVAAAEAETAALHDRLAELDAVAQQLEAAQEPLETAGGQVAVLRSEGERLKEEPVRLAHMIELLGEHEQCPVCGQRLGRSGLAAAHARLRKELNEIDAHLSDVRGQYVSQAAAVKAMQERIATLRNQLASRPRVERALGEIEAQRRAAEEDRAQLVDARRVEQDLTRALDENDYAHDSRARIPHLQARLDAIGYDPQRHQAVRKGRDSLAYAVREKSALDTARTQLETTETFRVGLETQLEGASEDVRRTAAEHEVLAAEAARLPGTEDELRRKEQELQEAAAARRRAADDRGQARQMVAWLDHQEHERTTFVARRHDVRRDLSAYDQLAEAFGKNGIQEMIMEDALPEIEDTANDLLARLTDGRMHVALETQRTGRTGGIINTLDVYVSDELGTRPYELFSGGERFRINFAIRIGLSRLLARRAGTPLQMLAIDEGFGSQDREGCDRLIEAIKTIQDDFERIIVITHLDEIKDAFPVRVEVTKDLSGSTFTMT
ncbi:MAG: AAA family ATPase [Chloroflexi bacterium]|nr:AAA family ATPase [Chloroflexota bacterium]